MDEADGYQSQLISLRKPNLKELALFFLRLGTTAFGGPAAHIGMMEDEAVTEHRSRKDWALQIKQMLDDRYSSAIKVRLVMDNLNTHSIASLYETFEPKEARRLAERLDIHYTPKHGSWLNMAEIELSVLKGQCLNRRIPDITTLQTQVATWERDRNNSAKKIVWQFTTPDARIKLKRLYQKL